jgi:hypothetical protein
MNRQHIRANTANGYPRKHKTEFEFSFKRNAGVVHWMLCVMKQMGLNNKPVSVKLQGVRIMEVRTFNKKDVALLEKNAAKQKKETSSSEQKQDAIVRVKAKK